MLVSADDRPTYFSMHLSTTSGEENLHLIISCHWAMTLLYQHQEPWLSYVICDDAINAIQKLSQQQGWYPVVPLPQNIASKKVKESLATDNKCQLSTEIDSKHSPCQVTLTLNSPPSHHLGRTEMAH